MKSINDRSLAHFIWISDSSIPPLYQKCLNSFIQKHPYWNVKVWFDKDCDKIIEGSQYKELFNKYTSFINRYNFIKYHILAQEGGWFVDMDIEWKKSLDVLYQDKIKDKFPELFIPVRRWPQQKKVNVRFNDDMLIYAEKGLFNELLQFINQRKDIDLTQKYEPFGPISLSQWVHQKNRNVIFLFEEEIQQNGYYCNHLNGKSWINY